MNPTVARLICFALALAFVASCGDDGAVMEPDNGDGDPSNETLAGLPEITAGFEDWLRMNAEPIPPRQSDPHNGVKNVYVNQTRDALAPNGQQQFPYPDGTVIVKSSVRPDKDFIGLIAVMEKAQGTNPSFGDWTFTEFTRENADDAFRKIAEGRVCENCHGAAASTDYSYTSLEP